MSIERPVVMGLRKKNIRLMKEIRFYRNCKERNSRYGLEMRHTHTKNAVVSVTSVISLQKKNPSLFLPMLYLKPLQNIWGKKKVKLRSESRR